MEGGTAIPDFPTDKNCINRRVGGMGYSLECAFGREGQDSIARVERIVVHFGLSEASERVLDAIDGLESGTLFDSRTDAVVDSFVRKGHVVALRIACTFAPLADALANVLGAVGTGVLVVLAIGQKVDVVVLVGVDVVEGTVPGLADVGAGKRLGVLIYLLLELRPVELLLELVDYGLVVHGALEGDDSHHRLVGQTGNVLLQIVERRVPDVVLCHHRSRTIQDVDVVAFPLGPKGRDTGQEHREGEQSNHGKCRYLHNCSVFGIDSSVFLPVIGANIGFFAISWTFSTLFFGKINLENAGMASKCRKTAI